MNLKKGDWVSYPDPFMTRVWWLLGEDLNKVPVKRRGIFVAVDGEDALVLNAGKTSPSYVPVHLLERIEVENEKV